MRKKLLLAAGIATGLVAGIVVVWRRQRAPCPAWLAGWLESPIAALLPPSPDRLELAPGMRVLDVGSGPGRLTIPIAKKVGPEGEVVALDVQQKMLQRLLRRAERSGVTNVRPLQADITAGPLAAADFDRALLVTVLGELPEPETALRVIARALKPGGILSVTEIAGDPHYQSRAKVRALAARAGLSLRREFGGRLAFTMNFVKA